MEVPCYYKRASCLYRTLLDPVRKSSGVALHGWLVELKVVWNLLCSSFIRFQHPNCKPRNPNVAYFNCGTRSVTPCTLNCKSIFNVTWEITLKSTVFLYFLLRNALSCQLQKSKDVRIQTLRACGVCCSGLLDLFKKCFCNLLL